MDKIPEEVAKYEPVKYQEVIADFDINDTLVYEDGQVLRLQDSKQGTEQLANLLANEPKDKKSLEYEWWKLRIDFLQGAVKSESL